MVSIKPPSKQATSPRRLSRHINGAPEHRTASIPNPPPCKQQTPHPHPLSLYPHPSYSAKTNCPATTANPGNPATPNAAATPADGLGALAPVGGATTFPPALPSSDDVVLGALVTLAEELSSVLENTSSVDSLANASSVELGTPPNLVLEVAKKSSSVLLAKESSVELGKNSSDDDVNESNTSSVEDAPKNTSTVLVPPPPMQISPSGQHPSAVQYVAAGQ